MPFWASLTSHTGQRLRREQAFNNAASPAEAEGALATAKVAATIANFKN